MYNRTLAKYTTVMNLTTAVTPHNPHKIYLIKRDKNSNYYINQLVCGTIYYPRFQRTTKKWLTEQMDLQLHFMKGRN